MDRQEAAMNESTILRLNGDWSLVATLVVSLGLAGLAWWLYWRESRTRKGVLRWLLPTLRSLAILWLLLMLAGPVLHHRQVIGELARVMFFVDVSQSMSVTDQQMPASRKLLYAQQAGWLPPGKLDTVLVDGAEALARAKRHITGTQAEWPNDRLKEQAKLVLQDLEDAAKCLATVRPESWKVDTGMRDRFKNELLNQATELTKRDIGNDVDRFLNDLFRLQDPASRWEQEFMKNLNVHAEKMTGDASSRAATAKYDTLPRYKRVESLLLDGSESLVSRLSVQHHLEVHNLGANKSEMLWWPESEQAISTSLNFTPKFGSTDLNSSVRTRLEAVKDDERVAVVVLSDGQHNNGPTPVQLAKLLGTKKTPIYVVGIGSANHPQDLAVLEVKVPETVYQDSSVKGSLEIKDDAAPGQQFTVKIEYQGTTLWEKNFITEQRGLRSIAFDFPIKGIVGTEMQKLDRDIKFSSLPLNLQVSVSTVKDERDTGNNNSVMRFSAITERPKVLFMDGRPRWEFRYLRNLMERDQKWDVNNLLAGVGGEQVKWVRGKLPGQFPPDKETLFSYALIIFGDLPQNTFTPNELEWMREFVEQRGGGILFVDGPRYPLRDYLTTPLKTLLPVEWRGAALEGSSLKQTFVASGTLEGAFSLAGDPERNKEIWAGLQVPRWAAGSESLPGSETILEISDASRKADSIVYRRVGAGRVLYNGIEETWRWRYEVGDIHHQKFWNQAAKWVMEAPFPVQDKHIARDSGAMTYAPGDTAEIRVRVRDSQGRLKLDAKAEAQLYKDGRKVATVALSADGNTGGVLRGRTAALEEGEYEVRVSTTELPDSEIKVRSNFTVKPQGAGEMAQLHCDEELLQQLAFHSGGTYLREEEIGRLAELLRPLSQGRVVESETILWQSWWWFVPLVLLLTLEWVLRKRSGMV